MSIFEEHKIITEVRDRCERLVMTAGQESPARNLTMADLEAAVRDIDPDGRYIQEALLLSICRRLPKDAVDTVIGIASSLEGMIAGEKAAAESLTRGCCTTAEAIRAEPEVQP